MGHFRSNLCLLSCRKLLCGEEARLSTMSDTHISLPYIYHQSPVYTLPCLSRPGGPHRRAEPQYKFVEEIITETTREIEMSEFEETGSEETEVGKDEQEKRDRGGCEEGEEEEDDDDKDSREEDGEQMCDSEQNQVASPGNLENGGEVSDGEKGQTGKEAVDNGGDSGIDKNAQNKLSENIAEETEEQHQKVAEKPKVEKDAAVKMEADQKDLPSKADDLKQNVLAEEESLDKSDEKSEKESFISAQVKMTVDETLAQVSKEPDKTQELSSVVQVQDKASTLASETAEKPADFTADIKSTLSVETGELSVKAQVSPSTTTKSEVKENSHTEPKEISKSEAAKVEDKVAKSNQDAKHDSNKGQDEESSLKANAKSLPEVKDQKPSSGEKPPTVQTELPKESTCTNADNKELHQGARESSQVQKSKLSEVSEKNKQS